MKDLILLIAQRLVTHAEAVEVTETEGDTVQIFELRVAKEDIGRVIGKQGKTARAIRNILNAVAVRTNRRVVLYIVEQPKEAGRSGRLSKRTKSKICDELMASQIPTSNASMVVDIEMQSETVQLAVSE